MVKNVRLLSADKAAELISEWEGIRERGLPVRTCAEEALGILHAWGYQHRLKTPVFSTVDEVVEEDMYPLTRAALVSYRMRPDTWEVWRGCLRELEELTENPASDDEVASAERMAADLFFDLDEAQVVVWAIDRLGVLEDMPEEAEKLKVLQRELVLCDQLFWQKTDLFVPVADQLREAVASFKDDLAVSEPELYLITEKFYAVIDEDYLASPADDFSVDTDEPVMGEVFKDDLLVAFDEVFSKVAVVPPAVAAADTTVEPPREERLQFGAQDGSWKGFVNVPLKLSDPGEPLSLWIEDSQGEPIPHGTLLLFGKEFKVEEGRVVIPFSELRAIVEGLKGSGESHQARLKWNNQR